jgi:HAD superfamily hydrolase (TIGR01509 family)
MFALVRNLKANYKVGLLTNFLFDWLDEILKLHNLYSMFDITIISPEHGTRKPEALIYQRALDQLKLSHSEVLFIDDKQAYVDGARRCGIRSLLFTGPAKLKEDLHSEEIKIANE